MLQCRRCQNGHLNPLHQRFYNLQQPISMARRDVVILELQTPATLNSVFLSSTVCTFAWLLPRVPDLALRNRLEEPNSISLWWHWQVVPASPKSHLQASTLSSSTSSWCDAVSHPLPALYVILWLCSNFSMLLFPKSGRTELGSPDISFRVHPAALSSGWHPLLSHPKSKQGVFSTMPHDWCCNYIVSTGTPTWVFQL